MLFSKQSQNYVKFIYNNFNSCMLKKIINTNSKSIETSFFKKIFKQIKQAEKYINSDIIQKNITKRQIYIDNIKQMRFPSIYNSKFFPEIIKKNVEMNTLTEFEYITKLDNRNIKFYFHTHDSSISYDILDEYVNYMLIWIYVLNLYGENSCSKTLSIFLFLTDFDKLLPNNNITILSQEQVNTGYTISCSPSSEIVIYRKEEWFKVFIHETFHNFGFDFSTTHHTDFHNKISKLFPINSHFNLYESYCEVWARIINACFCSYSILENKNNINEFVSYCDFLLQIERVFSLYQTNKILDYNGIRYETLYKKDDISITARNNLYKEEANVFAYYIVTSILLNDYSKFLKWCNKNNFEMIKFNKTPRTLDSFFNFIKSNYNTDTYLESLKCIEKINKKNNIHNDKFLKETLRMTILEMN